MKIYAKQIPPEYQESPLFIEEWPENVFIFGNRDYQQHDARLEDIRRGLENIADTLEDMQRGAAWTRNGNLHAAIWYEIPRDNGAGYTRAERLQIVEIALDYCGAMNSSSENDALCAALEIVTGRPWEYATICGCCQGEWQHIIYPAEYGREWLECFETEYFNTGSEWLVHDTNTAPDGPEDIDGFTMYAHGWSDEQIKKEIADAYGAPDAEVILYKFTGWSRTAEYMEV